jgi:class 3 adenylate cyclase/tetratricopeptide (TPR) repeat protein
MRSAWLSYVPYSLAYDILARPNASPVGRERHIHAVALFADVSGFTQISEALSKIGKVGAEELTQILNSYFEPMIDLIESYGGIIGKFGGDAMTVMFPYTRQSRAATARRALQCALDMQAAMRRYIAIPTSVGSFGLTMKAGLAIGSVLCTTVGDPASRLEFIIAGSVLDRCADAEHHAGRGEVVAHRALLDAAGPVATLEQRGDFGLVAALRRKARRAPLRPLDTVPSAATAIFARYAHPSIAQRLESGQLGFINEHRKVTILFVSFGGFDYDGDSQISARLQAYFFRVIQAIQRYDGFLNKIDMGDKGSKYIVLFGAPVAHENDEERAIRCALDLQSIDAAVRIGVNTGFVYCGQVGSPIRQEYTVMGDPVNLAARLMQAAGAGQILVSSFTQRYLARVFAWEPLAPLLVKGKAEPVAVYAARGAARAPVPRLTELAYVLPMVGRSRELQQAREQLAQARASRGQVIGITADAGMGKSRLSAEIVGLALEQGFIGYGGACQSYGTGSPYLVWQNIWRGFFEVDPTWPPELRAHHLSAQLEAIDARLPQRMPLLGPALNLHLPDNELTASFDSQQRAELLKSLLLTCLRHRATAATAGAVAAAPLLLMLEDCHWIDPLSQELLEYIGRNLADLPICLVALYRPPDSERSPLEWGARFGHIGEIRLAELTPAEVEQLIGLKLVHRFEILTAGPRDLVEQIAAKAQGNPFYVEELMNYISDRGIDPRDTRALQSLDLPDSMHSLIISRIDQLAENEKSVLKLASVIGRLFRATWLWGSYPEIGAPETVTKRLQILSNLELTPLDKLAPELEYVFKHIATQEVAYESLAVATRLVLHERIGDFMEQAYPDTLDLYLDMLAFHYGRSHNTEKQLIYFRAAGDAARAVYANQAAIDYYQRLLPLLPDEEQAGVLCDLGQIWQLIGKWAEAEGLYRQALALAEQTQAAHTLAQCQLLLGHLMWYKAAYPEALTWIEQARDGFERLGDRRGFGRSIGRLGLVYRLQGDYPRALAHFEQQSRIAAELGDTAGVVEALGHMGNVYQDRSESIAALDCYERQLAIATELGNRRERMFAIGNIGLVYQSRGDYASTLTHLAEVLDMAVEIGDQQTTTVAAINMGEVYSFQGDYAQALICDQYGLSAAIELDDRMAIAVTLENIAQTYLEQELFHEAEALIARAITIARSLNIPYFLAAELFGQAEIYAAQHSYAEAQAANDQALQVAAQVERKEILFKAQLLAIDLRVALGQRSHETPAAECASLLDVWPEDGEQAAIYYQLWRLTGSADQQSRAAELYHRLYAHTPNVEYRQRIQELTGTPPPEPPALPPPLITQERADLGALLGRVDALIATLL